MDLRIFQRGIYGILRNVELFSTDFKKSELTTLRLHSKRDALLFDALNFHRSFLARGMRKV